MTGDVRETGSERLASGGKIAALVLFSLILLAPTPAELPAEAQRLAAVTVVMAVLWLTQSIPIAATSLIPLVAFPLLGIQTADTVSQAYITKNTMLFFGGFLIALGIEKWGLHRRIALHIVRLAGTGLKRVVLGFMLATAFLSMWISNTASTLLMLPIGLAMLTSLREMTETKENGSIGADSAENKDVDLALSRFSVALMLGIAYSASVGGLTTLVGTPTNVQFQQIWSGEFPDAPEISAGQWIIALVPLGACLLLCAWGLLVWRLPPLPKSQSLDRRFFSRKLKALGPPSRAELLMFCVFAATALLWIFRTPIKLGSTTLMPGWGGWVERWLVWLGTDAEMAAAAVHDSTVAMAMSLLMFFIPADSDENRRTRYLMDWRTAEKMPWHILLLFGGGFAIAGAFSETGLSQWIGDQFAAVVENWPAWLMVAAICLLMTFLTEFTTNVATVSALLPVLAGTAVSVGVDPRLLMIPAAVSASCAFMLPIATPPNAIVFGSGRVRMADMARYGIVLNLSFAVLITVYAMLVLVPQFGISLDEMPTWSQRAM